MDRPEPNTTPEGSCFACGAGNSRGLQLVFHPDPLTEGVAVAEAVLDAAFMGGDGIAHGGIVCTLLDEAMVYACRAAGVAVVTVDLTVRFRRPVPVGVPIDIRGETVEIDRRLVRARAVVSRDGVRLAEGRGRFLVLPEESLPGSGTDEGLGESEPAV